MKNEKQKSFADSVRTNSNLNITASNETSQTDRLNSVNLGMLGDIRKNSQGEDDFDLYMTAVQNNFFDILGNKTDKSIPISDIIANNNSSNSSIQSTTSG